MKLAARIVSRNSENSEEERRSAVRVVLRLAGNDAEGARKALALLGLTEVARNMWQERQI